MLSIVTVARIIVSSCTNEGKNGSRVGPSSIVSEYAESRATISVDGTASPSAVNLFDAWQMNINLNARGIMHPRL